MKKAEITRTKDLLDRIARLSSAGEWGTELNPAQRSVLGYLDRANKFSRAPSNVADFMCTTRGTASQTLKSLESKGFLVQSRSSTDKRSISFDVTEAGHLLANEASDVDAVLSSFSRKDLESFQRPLEETLQKMLARRGYRSFGVCKTCKYHQTTKNGRSCSLLNLPLTGEESEEICYEHESA